jgi:hypothetical protein
MASTIMHICVAKELNKVLKVNEKEFFLGSIAPDISKLIGETKKKSHFLTTPKMDVPNISEFLNKYKEKLDNPFLLGYFIHLYTDKIWIDEFISTKKFESFVKLLDGTVVSVHENYIADLIYNDYTNMDIQLIDEYDLDLSLFCEDIQIKTKMDEIPVEKLHILTKKICSIKEEVKEEKNYIFDIPVIIQFIEYTTNKILRKIEEYDIKVHS